MPEKKSASKKPPKHSFGAHMSIAGGIHNALLAALEVKTNTVQVFVKNQRQWRAPPLKPDDVSRWHELLATPGFGPAVAHATYLINLASADKSLYEKSWRAFADELERCTALSIPYLVVHPGAAGEQAIPEALSRVSAALNRIFEDRPAIETAVLLETTAGQGTALGRDFGELGGIIADVQEPQRVGVCVDTCHVFAAGYDIRDQNAYARMITEADREVGIERIACWHFNDSKQECGSHRDRHEHIGRGQIGMAGFRNILADERFRGVPMILETPKGEDESGREWDRVNLRRLRSIAARVSQPL